MPTWADKVAAEDPFVRLHVVLRVLGLIEEVTESGQLLVVQRHLAGSRQNPVDVEEVAVGLKNQNVFEIPLLLKGKNPTVISPLTCMLSWT